MPHSSLRSRPSPGHPARPRPVARSRRGLLALAASATAVLAISGCSSDNLVRPTTHTVTGHVTMTGVLRDANAATLGLRTVTDASGVRVYLVNAGMVVDSALTVGGVYRLTGQQGAGYQVLARTGAVLSDSSAVFTIGRSDYALPQPIEMASIGRLRTWPNPFTTTLNTEFVVDFGGDVDLGVWDAANLRVLALRTATGVVPGTYLVPWDGTDGAGHALPDGPYWIVYSGESNDWAELVFKGP